MSVSGVFVERTRKFETEKNRKKKTQKEKKRKKNMKIIDKVCIKLIIV